MEPNVPGKLSKADIAALEALRQKLMPLTYNLGKLLDKFKTNPNAPPDWPAIRLSIGSLIGALNSLQALLNDDPAMAEVFRSLHPYPMAPFNIEDPQMAGLANVILRKKPDVPDEKWILDRLAKAQEFAHVPSDWNIEPRKPAKNDGKSDEEGDEGKDTIKTLFKRQRGTLNEDQLTKLWADASEVVEDEMGNVGSGSGEQSGDASEASSPEDMTIGGPEAGKKADLVKKEEEKPMLMPLEVLQKLMSTGLVEKPDDDQNAGV